MEPLSVLLFGYAVNIALVIAGLLVVLFIVSSFGEGSFCLIDNLWMFIAFPLVGAMLLTPVCWLFHIFGFGGGVYIIFLIFIAIIADIFCDFSGVMSKIQSTLNTWND